MPGLGYRTDFIYTVNMAKLLGIDLGTKRVGLAYSNVEETFAFPLKVIKVQNISALLENLANQIVEEYKALSGASSVPGAPGGKKVIVIGESKTFGGVENPIMVHVHKLKAILEAQGYTIVLIPEFMTSAEASRFQGDTDLLDASAATIILQSYLDKKKHEEDSTTNQVME